MTSAAESAEPPPKAAPRNGAPVASGAAAGLARTGGWTATRSVCRSGAPADRRPSAGLLEIAADRHRLLPIRGGRRVDHLDCLLEWARRCEQTGFVWMWVDRAVEVLAVRAGATRQRRFGAPVGVDDGDLQRLGNRDRCVRRTGPVAVHQPGGGGVVRLARLQLQPTQIEPPRWAALEQPLEVDGRPLGDERRQGLQHLAADRRDRARRRAARATYGRVAEDALDQAAQYRLGADLDEDPRARSRTSPRSRRRTRPGAPGARPACSTMLTGRPGTPSAVVFEKTATLGAWIGVRRSSAASVCWAGATERRVERAGHRQTCGPAACRSTCTRSSPSATPPWSPRRRSAPGRSGWRGQAPHRRRGAQPRRRRRPPAIAPRSRRRPSSR